MGKIRVSVALASYNGEAYVKEQIESILKNLSAEDEIVVSDDGSTDRTLDRIEECKGNKVPPVFAVHIRNPPGTVTSISSKSAGPDRHHSHILHTAHIPYRETTHRSRPVYNRASHTFAGRFRNRCGVRRQW